MRTFIIKTNMEWTVISHKTLLCSHYACSKYLVWPCMQSGCGLDSSLLCSIWSDLLYPWSISSNPLVCSKCYYI